MTDAIADRLYSGIFSQMPELSELDSIDLGSRWVGVSRWKETTTIYVYFIQCGRNGPIKIGTAWNPIKRLRTLQCCNHRRLSLRAAFVDKVPTLEFRLHDLFVDARIRNEWFRPTPDILDFIEWLNSPGLVSWEHSRK